MERTHVRCYGVQELAPGFSSPRLVALNRNGDFLVVTTCRQECRPSGSSGVERSELGRDRRSALSASTPTACARLAAPAVRRTLRGATRFVSVWWS